MNDVILNMHELFFDWILELRKEGLLDNEDIRNIITDQFNFRDFMVEFVKQNEKTLKEYVEYELKIISVIPRRN